MDFVFGAPERARRRAGVARRPHRDPAGPAH
jgi:hypothetical protein